MAKPLLSDALWERIEPLLPELPPHPKGGHPWVSNRQGSPGFSLSCVRGFPGRCCRKRWAADVE